MSTTLTREALLGKTELRYEEVDVAGFGRVGIRELGELRRSQRIAECFDDKGKFIQRSHHMRRVHTIVDQVMTDSDTPMFANSDSEQLASGSGTKLDQLVAAVNRFNGDNEKKDAAELSDSSDS